MSDIAKGAVVIGLILLILAVVVVGAITFGVMILYSLNWSLLGYTPTTHDAIVSLFILSLFGGVGGRTD